MDFQAAFQKEEGSGRFSSFNWLESAVYLIVSPVEGLYGVYENNRGLPLQGYAIWSKEWLVPFYIKVGRAFIPYGIHWQEHDLGAAVNHSAFEHGSDFLPFNPSPDSGIEIGLNPKTRYFLNVSVTNGIPGAPGMGTASLNNAKAWTGRAGWIFPFLGLGITGYRNHPLGISVPGVPPPLGLDERWGFFGWARQGRFVALGQVDKGSIRPNDPALSKNFKQAVHAELGVDLVKEKVLLKGGYDFLDPNLSTSGDVRERYLLGLEWFPFPIPVASVQIQYQVRRENPEMNNDLGVAAFHLWF